MKLYFSTKHMPGMAHLSVTERLGVVRAASSRLTPPEKLLLNLLKLAILIPAFYFVLQVSDSFVALLWAALIIAAYPLLFTPLYNAFTAKHIKPSDIPMERE